MKKYIFEDDPFKQREHIETAYAEIMARNNGVVIPEETLVKYRGIYNDPTIKLAVAIKIYYEKNLMCKTVYVKIKGSVIEVGFGADGKKKSVGNRPTPEKATTYEHLETLLETGVYAYSQENKKAQDDKIYARYVPYFHYFVNNVSVDGINIPVKIQIREMYLQNGTEYRYYTHGFIKNEETPAPV